MWRVWFYLMLVLSACGTARTPAPTDIPLIRGTIAPPTTPRAFKVPEFIAPDFTLTGIDGSSYTLSDYRGAWVLLNFWQTTCEPCATEMAVFQQIHDEMDTLTVLAVNVGEDEATIQPFLQEHELTFPVLYSTDAVSTDYFAMTPPQTIVIDPDGEVVYRQFGPVELETFREQLDSLMLIGVN